MSLITENIITHFTVNVLFIEKKRYHFTCAQEAECLMSYHTCAIMGRMEDIAKNIAKCKTICEKYEKFMRNREPGDLFFSFCSEVINMGFLIAACDGYVDSYEIGLINQTFGVVFDYTLLAKNFGLDYLSEDSFLQKVPKTIQEVAKLEKAEYMGAKCFLADTRTLYNVFKQFGGMIINCNGARLKFEVMLLNFFTNVSLEYIFSIEERDELLSGMVEPVRHTFSGSDGQNITDRVRQKPEEGVDYSRGSLAVGRSFDSAPQPSGAPDMANAPGGGPSGRVSPISDDELRNLRSDAGDGDTRASLAEKVSLHRETLREQSSMPGRDEINELLGKIDCLTGLGCVKKEIHDMVNLLMVQRIRERKGLKSTVISRHLVFTGNPGTGKTTVARILAKIYKSMGILKTGQMIETDRAGLVAGYMGQTAEKVKEVADKAMGGILFIDEAYTLVYDNEGDFGQEAVDTLLKIMEDKRDELIVIVAGYPDLMEKFLDSNPGLRSRFNKYIHFEDYSDEELLTIFKAYVEEQDYSLAEGIDEVILSKIADIREKAGENFGNAREIRNFFEKVISRQANRIMAASPDMMMEDENLLTTITAEDLDIE